MENKNLAIVLKENEKTIKKIAPKYMDVKRLLTLAVQAVEKNPILKQCTMPSVVDFCIKCAEAGTDKIGAGGMWAVPFYDNKNKRYIMTAIPDWRLIIEKARQAGVIKYATADIVYQGDEFYVEKGFNPQLIHKPNLTIERKPENIILAYCIYILPDGTKDFEVMTKQEIDKIKERSKAKSETSPWQTDYSEMAKKTVVKRALKKFEGASIEVSKLMEMDNKVVGYEDIDYEPFEEPKELKDETKSTAEEKEQSEQKEQELTVFQEDQQLICENCGSKISSRVAEYSKEKFGKVLCVKCQKQA